MSTAVRVPMARRAELLIRPMGESGQVVVKDPLNDSYYNLGAEEAFLLARLDGTRTAEAICGDFEAHFGGPLTESDLDEFVELARARGLLGSAPAPDGPPPRRARPRQSLLAWRYSLLDPDWLFTRLEPKLWFFWTKSFVALSLGCILAAALLVWDNRAELAHPLARGLGVETLVLGGLTLLAVTTCHEFAHGLTCKHHGGEVHEVGFLLMFFMPGMYCNVSDSWLMPERSKRLWVTLAGGYFELFLWSLAVFIWRVTVTDSLVNRMAWTVVSVSGARAFFNFNPLLKLDGYYFLSDLVDVPNLRQRAVDSWTGHLRWLFWGGPRPAPQRRGAFLLGLGMMSWCFSVGMLSLMVKGFAQLMFPRAGWLTVGIASLLGGYLLRGLIRGVFAGEVNEMIAKRRRRATAWALGLAALPAVLALGQVEDHASGVFKFRPARRMELRAPVAGFLKAVYLDEGQRVSPGMAIAQLEIPDLDTRIAQKRAEVDKARAELRMVEIGTRPEEVVEQRGRVERAKAWRDRARQDLARLQEAHRQELAALRAQVLQDRAERKVFEGTHRRAKALFDRGYLSPAQYHDEEKNSKVAQAKLDQAEARYRAREAEGTLEAEAELARRNKELADAQASLTLLEAGSRPEELAASRARLAQLAEELSYLEGLLEKLQISSPLSGVITTPRLREKIGQHLPEGELIGEVQAVSALEAEIAIDEQTVSRARVGQAVELRARALTFQTFHARVDRIAPSAVRGEADTKATVTVYCRLEGPAAGLRSEMTGYARIDCGRRPIGEILAERILGFLRTEFWL